MNQSKPGISIPCFNNFRSGGYPRPLLAREIVPIQLPVSFDGDSLEFSLWLINKFVPRTTGEASSFGLEWDLSLKRTAYGLQWFWPAKQVQGQPLT